MRQVPAGDRWNTTVISFESKLIKGQFQWFEYGIRTPQGRKQGTVLESKGKEKEEITNLGDREAKWKGHLYRNHDLSSWVVKGGGQTMRTLKRGSQGQAI